MWHECVFVVATATRVSVCVVPVRNLQPLSRFCGMVHSKFTANINDTTLVSCWYGIVSACSNCEANRNAIQDLKNW